MAYVKEIPCAQVLRLTGRVCITATALPPVVPALSGAKAAEKGFGQAGPRPPASMAEKGFFEIGAGIRHASLQRCHLPLTRIPSIVWSRLSRPFSISYHSSSAGKPNASSTPPITNVGASLPVHKGATCPRPAPFPAACFHSAALGTSIPQSGGKGNKRGKNERSFPIPKRQAQLPSSQERVKKGQPSCSGRPFPVPAQNGQRRECARIALSAPAVWMFNTALLALLWRLIVAREAQSSVKSVCANVKRLAISRFGTINMRHLAALCYYHIGLHAHTSNRA